MNQAIVDRILSHETLLATGPFLAPDAAGCTADGVENLPKPLVGQRLFPTQPLAFTSTFDPRTVSVMSYGPPVGMPRTRPRIRPRAALPMSRTRRPLSGRPPRLTVARTSPDAPHAPEKAMSLALPRPR